MLYTDFTIFLSRPSRPSCSRPPPRSKKLKSPSGRSRPSAGLSQSRPLLDGLGRLSMAASSLLACCQLLVNKTTAAGLCANAALHAASNCKQLCAATARFVAERHGPDAGIYVSVCGTMLLCLTHLKYTQSNTLFFIEWTSCA